MKWVKRGLQYFCVVVLTLEQQNKPKQTPVCMGSMSNVDGDVKQPYRRPSVCVWQWSVGWDHSLFCPSLRYCCFIVMMMMILEYVAAAATSATMMMTTTMPTTIVVSVCVSVFCLILRFLFLSWRLDFSHTEAIRPTGKLRYFTERERIHVVRDFQFQLRFLPIYDNTLCTTTYFYWFKVREKFVFPKKVSINFCILFAKNSWLFLQVCLSVRACVSWEKTSPKRKL